MQFIDDAGISVLYKSMLWPIVIALVVVMLFKVLFEIIIPDLFAAHKRKRLFASGAQWHDDIDLLRWMRGMEPTEFEAYVTELFSRLGYDTEHLGQSGDHGLDVQVKKDGKVSYVQCKKYAKNHKVGEPEVRNFLGALHHAEAEGVGYFVTTADFTQEAKRFAETEAIELVDGSKLVTYIHSVS